MELLEDRLLNVDSQIFMILIVAVLFMLFMDWLGLMGVDFGGIGRGKWYFLFDCEIGLFEGWFLGVCFIDGCFFFCAVLRKACFGGCFIVGRDLYICVSIFDLVCF